MPFLSPTDLLPLASYCFVMSGTPGPNNVLLASSGANFGYRRALPLILGIQAGGALLTLLTCLGLGSLFAAFPVLHQILRVTGALYLIWLAWKLSAMSVAEAGQPMTMLQAILFQAINPKSWVKAITLASVFMPTGLSVPLGALLVTLTSIMVGLPVSSTWALFGVAIRRFLQDPLKRRLFNLSMGGTLVLLAISFLR
ncbi:LysE family translocator [Paucibacter sp. Y2R2-4]|uniref:LysE family translocator n=1 Tax=Paucibacter sp. Y2R2-4 TaxID=2893553 RepID=UPI0021E3DAB3|nr:LysE family translocator [Paucibacter sp. Y2R2-4]MCV2350471.1 LysE family translocator [Paucibacter sp. Y2R2-4]